MLLAQTLGSTVISVEDCSKSSTMYETDAALCFHAAARELEGFIPKSTKDFEEMAQAIAAKYFLPNAKGNGAQYKAGVKTLLHHILRPMAAAEVKDVETAVAGIRADKLKEEKLATGGKKTLKKAALNVGKGGGSAGLEDYVYDDLGVDDDYDFM